MRRYVVTELEGFLSPSSGKSTMRPGLSCHVLDTAYNHALVASYRTEDNKGFRAHYAERVRVRELAEAKRAELEAAYP